MNRFLNRKHYIQLFNRSFLQQLNNSMVKKIEQF